jgi:predicted nucleic-acid-binding Zn-ribbon protein
MLLQLCLSLVCKAQNELELTNPKSDSLAIVSRAKADMVLNKFDTIKGMKLLYSLKDKDYYVVIKDDCNYKEFYVLVDSSDRVIEMRILKSKKEDRKLFSQAFELSKYHSNFITRMPNATYVRGEPSYFTIKDQMGKRYGEYSLSSLTLPNPIDGDLYGYLFRRIIEQSTKKIKAP